MATFKDHLQSDISVFSNADEFAETLIVNGTTMIAILDKNIIGTMSKTNNDRSVLNKNNVLMLVSATEYGDLPVTDMRISIGDDKYCVVSAEDENGMYEIELEAVVA